MDTKDDLKEKLDYIGMNLEEIPDFLNNVTSFKFNPSRYSSDKEHRVFKYVPIDKIEILLTPHLRSDDIKKKYSEAEPLIAFLNPKTNSEEEIEKYTYLLKMIATFSISEVENISELQKKFEKNIPFKVKYNKNQLWQIYYSEEADKYFMLACIKEDECAEMFYLLKKQIEYFKKPGRKVPKIYVPINCLGYSEEFLTKSELSDIENQLWLFTKNWPLIFDVYDKNDEYSLQIVGDTLVYENVKSNYKIKISSEEEAKKFYRLLKALFILQTEVGGKYNFTTKIDSRNNLEIYLENTKMTYDKLADFIKDEFNDIEKIIGDQNKLSSDLTEKLENLKIEEKVKEREYLIKQREISTYLECKKTFFGKVKYFFKGSKTKKNAEQEEINLSENIQVRQVNLKPIKIYIDEKKFHTIEDLITINSLREKGSKYIKNLEQDIKALEYKLINISKKVENATLYINEIDKHKKSIFDFWKFANKDENLAIEMGNERDISKNVNKLKRTFNLEMDLEELGVEQDKIARRKLSKDEMDSIYIAKTNILPIINMIRLEEMNKESIENMLDILKQELENNDRLVGEEVFDIFGNISGDSTKIKYIGSKSHRENEKDKYKILNINKKIDIFDFTEKIQGIVNYLNEAFSKIKSPYDMSIYKIMPINEQIKRECFDVYNLSIEDELEKYENSDEGALNLIKLNIKEDLPLLYYTNSMFFDNTNKTLPEGMDLSTNVLIDTKRMEYKLVNKLKFRTNCYFENDNNLENPKPRDIFVYEYDTNIIEKKENEEKENDEKKDDEKGKIEKQEENSKEEKIEKTEEPEELKQNDEIEKILQKIEERKPYLSSETEEFYDDKTNSSKT